MNILIYIFSGMIFFIVLGLFIYFIYLKYKEIDEPLDNTILWNLMPQYSDGYADLVIDKTILTNGRIGVYSFPRDIDWVKAKKDKKYAKIKKELIFYQRNKLIPLPKNIFADHRNHIIGLPPSPEDLPESFKKSEIGALIMKYLSDLSSEDHQARVLREEIESVKIINRKLSDRQELADFLEDQAEITKDKLKSLSKEEKTFGVKPT